MTCQVSEIVLSRRAFSGLVEILLGYSMLHQKALQLVKAIGEVIEFLNIILILTREGLGRYNHDSSLTETVKRSQLRFLKLATIRSFPKVVENLAE